MKTKKAKRVRVRWLELTWVQDRSEYSCPTCGTTFIGTLNKNTLRFICDCGQELVIKKQEEVCYTEQR